MVDNASTFGNSGNPEPEIYGISVLVSYLDYDRQPNLSTSWEEISNKTFANLTATYLIVIQ